MQDADAAAAAAGLVVGAAPPLPALPTATPQPAPPSEPSAAPPADELPSNESLAPIAEQGMMGSIAVEPSPEDAGGSSGGDSTGGVVGALVVLAVISALT